ncbi:MAG TPA: type II toxin-antitoxin system prevent-host-death family antitoxin [Acidobacteriaceae bacterium]|nr:type II toxin-antitoxin system prevent-host-death family antitoxin [Acidobacteriaceae bacterium]
MPAEKAISATDANRRFSRILDGVRRGRTYLVTSHGQPVARISPVDEPGQTVMDARKALLARLRGQKIINVGPWTRDELYEDKR